MNRLTQVMAGFKNISEEYTEKLAALENFYAKKYGGKDNDEYREALTKSSYKRDCRFAHGLFYERTAEKERAVNAAISKLPSKLPTEAIELFYHIYGKRGTLENPINCEDFDSYDYAFSGDLGDYFGFSEYSSGLMLPRQEPDWFDVYNDKTLFPPIFRRYFHPICNSQYPGDIFVWGCLPDENNDKEAEVLVYFIQEGWIGLVSHSVANFLKRAQLCIKYGEEQDLYNPTYIVYNIIRSIDGDDVLPNREKAIFSIDEPEKWPAHWRKLLTPEDYAMLSP